jgi:biopolymer transport protein ExbD
MTTYNPYKQLTTCITIVLLQAILLGSCGQSTGKKETKADQQSSSNMPVEEELHLNMPRGENTESTRSLTQSTVSLILLGDNKWYSYNGTDIKRGAYCDQQQFRALLLKNKKKWDDSLFVMIKPSDKATPQQAVDALDEMAISKIKRYAIVNPNANDEKYFNISSGLTDSRLDNEPLTSGIEKIKVNPPVASPTEVTDESLIIRLTNEGKIGYKIQGKEQEYHFLSTRNKEALITAIAKYKTKYPTGHVFIKGEKDAKYRDFSLVVEALKENNEMRYKLLAEDE